MRGSHDDLLWSLRFMRGNGESDFRRYDSTIQHGFGGRQTWKGWCAAYVEYDVQLRTPVTELMKCPQAVPTTYTQNAAA